MTQPLVANWKANKLEVAGVAKYTLLLPVSVTIPSPRLNYDKESHNLQDMKNILLCERTWSQFMSNCHVLRDYQHGKDKKKWLGYEVIYFCYCCFNIFTVRVSKQIHVCNQREKIEGWCFFVVCLNTVNGSGEGQVFEIRMSKLP